MVQLADDITPDDLKIFLGEAEEQLQLLDDEVIQLEKAATEEGLATIFRAAHTLKGSSAMLGYAAMSRVAHAMESLLDKLRNGEVTVTPELVDALLHSIDALRILTDELIEERGVEVDFESLVAELEACASKAPQQATDDGGTSKALELNDDALDMISTALAAGDKVFEITASVVGDEAFSSVRLFQLTTELTEQARLIASSPTLEEIQAEKNGMEFAAIVGSEKSVDDLNALVLSMQDIGDVKVSTYSPDPASPAQAPGKATASSDAVETRQKAAVTQTVRIDVDRLDSLMNLIGELIIDGTRLVQIGRSMAVRYKADDLVESLGKTAAHVAKVVNDLQEDVMQVRMLPIATVFSSFPR
ncbi:MAG: Hpt domain-containing protein, partial [Chloroflexi bacterium]|nr:Hpt domain-containing protein [Chloroflexota bacterium]